MHEFRGRIASRKSALRAVAAIAVVVTVCLAPASAAGTGADVPGGVLVLSCSRCEGIASSVFELYALTPLGRLRTIPGTDDGQDPSWSPDGRSIAYVRRELWVTRADGTRARPLTGRRSVSALSAPDWSPDGRTIVYVRPAPVPLGCCRFDLWRIQAAGGRPEPLHAPRFSAHNPSWSPDGNRIAYNDSRGLLWSVSIDGSGKRRLGPLDLRGVAPRWSPDGTRIAFIESRVARTLSVLDLGTSRVRRLFRLDANASPVSAHAWSPDGRWLALGRMRGYACDVPPSSRCEDFEVSLIRVRDRARRVIYRAKYGLPSGLDWRR